MKKIKGFLLIGLFMYIVVSFEPIKVQAGTTVYDDIYPIDFCSPYDDRGSNIMWYEALIKFNISAIAKGYTLEEVIFYFWPQAGESEPWDVYSQRINSQTWNSNMTPAAIWALEKDDIYDWGEFYEREPYLSPYEVDITEIFEVDYNLNYNNFSILLYHPDYVLQAYDDPGGTINCKYPVCWVQSGMVEIGEPNTDDFWFVATGEGEDWGEPYLKVTISSQPAYSEGQGHNFTVEIQPHDMTPSRSEGAREFYSSSWGGQWHPWQAAMSNDAVSLSIGLGAGSGTRYANWEWTNIAYPQAIDALHYDMGLNTGAGVTNGRLYIYTRSGGQAQVFSSASGAGTGTWTTLSDDHWAHGRVSAYYRMDTTQTGTGYFLGIDQMAISFNTILETHSGVRSWNGTEYLETVTIQIIQSDVNVSLINVPPNYNFTNVLPNCTIEQVGQTLTLVDVAKGEYTITFSTMLTKPDLATIVLNYYINGTNEPLPANTLNSSYVVANTEYRIEPYTSRFIWDKDEGNVTIHSYDYFHRLLVNQSFEIAEDAIFTVIDIGLQLYKITVHCNTMATLNITNSLNESYYPTFEISPENATLIKTLWLYGENVTITTHSNDYGDLTHQIDTSRTSFVNFKYKLPAIWKGEYPQPAGVSALYSTMKTLAAAGILGTVGYLVGYYLKKHRIAEKIDRHIF